MKRNIENTITQGGKLLNSYSGYQLKLSEFQFFEEELKKDNDFWGILTIFKYGVAIGYRMAQKQESRRAEQ